MPGYRVPGRAVTVPRRPPTAQELELARRAALAAPPAPSPEQDDGVAAQQALSDAILERIRTRHLEDRRDAILAAPGDRARQERADAILAAIRARSRGGRPQVPGKLVDSWPTTWQGK